MYSPWVASDSLLQGMILVPNALALPIFFDKSPPKTWGMKTSYGYLMSNINIIYLVIILYIYICKGVYIYIFGPGRMPCTFENETSVCPIASMYGIFTYIYHRNQPNVGKYTIHGWYGYINNKDDRIRIAKNILCPNNQKNHVCWPRIQRHVNKLDTSDQQTWRNMI